MKTFHLTTLALGLAVAGISTVHATSNVETLELRIRELESRLEKLEPKTTPATANPQVEKLTQKVNVLERKIEVQNEVAKEDAKKAPKLEAGAEGFKITSADKKHQLRIRAAVQTDARVFTHDVTPNLNTDTFDLKQARIWVEGYVWNDIFYKIMPDFAASGNILPDAYLDYTYLTEASFLAGKYKPPVSLERLQGDSDTVFLERAYPTYLAPNRDVGFELHGSFGAPGQKTEKVAGPIDYKNFFTYQLAVMNGAGDNGSPNYNSPDSNNNKEFLGRLWLNPFQHTGHDLLEGLGFGIAGSYADANNQAISSQATPIGRTVYLNYANTRTGFGTPVSEGDTHRIYPQAFWYAGPFGLMGEYVFSTQNLLSQRNVAGRLQRINVNQSNTAWQIQASYVLTGEDNSFGAIKPIANFNPLEGRWGALQVAGRWTELNVDNDTFIILDPNRSATRTTAWTLGANWFLNANALIRVDYEQASFTGGAANGKDRPTEQVFATRFQLNF